MGQVEFKRLMLLDGYNVIYKISELAGGEDRSLREKRNALVMFMRKWQQKRNFGGKICIVFDGRDGFGGAGQSVHGIDCYYTATKEEADDRIITMIKNTSDPSKVVVISDDNYVRNNCKAFRVDTKPVSYLLDATKTRLKPGVKKQEEKKLDATTQRIINDELKKEWGIE